MVLLMTIEPDVVTIMEERPGEYMKRNEFGIRRIATT